MSVRKSIVSASIMAFGATVLLGACSKSLSGLFLQCDTPSARYSACVLLDASPLDGGQMALPLFSVDFLKTVDD